MNTKLSHLFETKQKLIDRVGQHSFLQRCSQKAVSVEELKFFLVQQGIYSGYFTRYLCSMMGNLPKSEYVVRVADNLCDELGLTHDHSTQHSTTYREMLASFGLTLEGAKPLEGTRRFIDTMFDHCRDLRMTRKAGPLGPRLVDPGRCRCLLLCLVPASLWPLWRSRPPMLPPLPPRQMGAMRSPRRQVLRSLRQ